MDIVILTVLSVVVAAELGLAGLVWWLRQGCPWLIVKSDLMPPIDGQGLRRFVINGWDPFLGWIRKPNTAHDETGRNNSITRYHIDSNGARRTPGYEEASPRVLAYGDSFTFGRQVNDDETWPYFLSKSLGVRVDNRGVGNYGIDQALMRLEREYPQRPAPIILMGVVPETICRVASVWKHFSEYGNSLGFKPRFTLDDDGSLRFIPNPVDLPEKFFRIRELLPWLMENDDLYARKFKLDILGFPFLWRLWRTRRRNVPLLTGALADRFSGGGSNAFHRVMERNIQVTAELYKDPRSESLLLALVNRFAEFARTNGATPVLVMMPQLLDLHHLRTGNHYYAPFLKKAGRIVKTIDFGTTFTEDAIDSDNYIDDVYGGHLLVQGNKMIADRLTSVLWPILVENVLNKQGEEETSDKMRDSMASVDCEPNSYPFTNISILKVKKRYSRSPFYGRDFLRAWHHDRGKYLGSNEATLSRDDACSSGEPYRVSGGVVRSNVLLRHLLIELETKAKPADEVMQWVDSFVKKFEVTKRIHGEYKEDFRAVDPGDHNDLHLYVLAALVFQRAYANTGALPYLNVLLKINDTLCARFHELKDEDKALIGNILSNEREHVGRLAEKVGAPL